MKFSHLHISLVFLLIVSGCKKAELDDSYSFLVGKWRWTDYSYRSESFFLGDLIIYDSQLPPEEFRYNTLHDMTIEFDQDGCVVFEDRGRKRRGGIDLFKPFQGEVGWRIESKVFKANSVEQSGSISIRAKGNDTLYVYSLPKGLPVLGGEPPRYPYLFFVRE